MRVIEMLAEEVDGLSASTIARKLDVNKSIAFRILSTLRNDQYIYQEPLTQVYRLTYRISNIAMKQQANAHLTEQCFPIIHQLAEECGELVRLAVVEGGRPVWIHSASGPSRRLRIDPAWTTDLFWNVHAVAKAVLIPLSDKELRERVGPGPFRPLTALTITSIEGLIKNIGEARKLGFAISCDEAEVGVGAVAAPIYSGDGQQRRCVAVVSIAAPTSRVSCDALRGWGKRLLEASNRLEVVWPLRGSG
jgi:IclR family acetate operon transcriptional repressor